MSKYRHIIFDADHTLIDFNADEKRAFYAAFRGTPLAREEIVQHMWEYSLRNWGELGLNEVNNPVIRKQYHARTYEHVHALFVHAATELGLQNADEAEHIFLKTLCLPTHPHEGALETVKALSEKYQISIATNGLADMQRARLTEFKPYLHKLFISEEMDTIKPAEEFGNILLSTLSARAEECLFIGDSLTSDIALANKFKMDAVWCNPGGRSLPEGYQVVGQIRTLSELLNIL